MKMSTRNVIKGKVLDIKEGMVMAKVKADIGGGQAITAIVTDEALKEPNVKVGDEIKMLVKGTSVMLGQGLIYSSR
jgi:molybdopterin-binding protein